MISNNRFSTAGEKKRLVIGMSGASGADLGIGLLEGLRDYPEWETHLIITKGAEKTILQETKYTPEEVMALADVVHDLSNIGASVASGTFKVEGMVVVPCSMKTVAGIATGYSDNLLLRAADVNIKERRKLILVARESPFSPIHLRNMLSLSDMGVSILPPMLTYYNHPASVEDMTNHMIGKILNYFGVEFKKFTRWGEAKCV